MRQLFVGVMASLLTLSASAALEPLDNQSLSAIDGQSGANIELDLRLNQTITGTPASATKLCSDPLDCRLGISFNNRTDGSGNKLWLVLKGLSGGIYIPQLGLDGSDITYKDTGGNNVWQAAVKFTLGGSTNKIQINNFGFESLAVETTISGTEGYRVLTEKDGTGAYGATFTDGKYTNAGFDNGKEVGFLGLNINGNLAINGSIKMFSCPATHPRCA